jgi:hypothetical protein
LRLTERCGRRREKDKEKSRHSKVSVKDKITQLFNKFKLSLQRRPGGNIKLAFDQILYLNNPSLIQSIPKALCEFDNLGFLGRDQNTLLHSRKLSQIGASEKLATLRKVMIRTN